MKKEKTKELNQNTLKDFKKSVIKGTKGITLIALVITIVVLLILAAVSITAVFGDNGILQLAKEAKEKTNKAVGKEQEEIGNISGILGEYANVENGNTQVPSSTPSQTPTEMPNQKTLNELEQGEFVLIPNGTKKIKCMVLYNDEYNNTNNKSYGVQVITTEMTGVGELTTFGHITFFPKLKEIIDSSLDNDVKNYISLVRPFATNPNGEDSTWYYGTEDFDTLKNIQYHNYIQTPFYTQAGYDGNEEENTRATTYIVNENFEYYEVELNSWDSLQSDWAYVDDEELRAKLGIHAIFTLKSDVSMKFVGSGTYENPYLIEINQ